MSEHSSGFFLHFSASYGLVIQHTFPSEHNSPDEMDVYVYSFEFQRWVRIYTEIPELSLPIRKRNIGKFEWNYVVMASRPNAYVKGSIWFRAIFGEKITNCRSTEWKRSTTSNTIDLFGWISKRYSKAIMK